MNQDSFNQIQISSSAYTSGSSPSFGNISGNKLTIGSGVELREASHRADLLEIRSLTSGWGGIQIKNSTSEYLWSLMGDGTKHLVYMTIYPMNGHGRLLGKLGIALGMTM